jgi:hypothetical protein
VNSFFRFCKPYSAIADLTAKQMVHCLGFQFFCRFLFLRQLFQKIEYLSTATDSIIAVHETIIDKYCRSVATILDAKHASLSYPIDDERTWNSLINIDAQFLGF